MTEEIKNQFIEFYNSEYYKVNAINNSYLNIYEQSPLRAELIRIGKIKKKITEEMLLGTAFHSFLLENKSFMEKYEIHGEFETPRSPQQNAFCDEWIKAITSDINIQPEILYASIYKAKESEDKRKDNAQKILNQFQPYINFSVTIAQNNRVPLSRKNLETIENMHKRLFSNKSAAKLLNFDGYDIILIESPIYFTYTPGETTNEKIMYCKAKPDIVLINKRNKEICIIDIKTCHNNVLGAFIGDFYHYKYYRQLSFYDHATRTGLSFKMNDGETYDDYQYSHKIIVASKEEDVYDNAIYNIDLQTIERGREEICELLYKVYYARLNNQFDYPLGYYNGTGEYNMPIWKN